VQICWRKKIVSSRATVACYLDAAAPADVLRMRLEKRTKERDEEEKECDAAIKTAEILKRKITELEAAGNVWSLWCSIFF
jgi:hypothetical protein